MEHLAQKAALMLGPSSSRCRMQERRISNYFLRKLAHGSSLVCGLYAGIFTLRCSFYFQPLSSTRTSSRMVKLSVLNSRQPSPGSTCIGTSLAHIFASLMPSLGASSCYHWRFRATNFTSCYTNITHFSARYCSWLEAFYS